MVRPSGKILAAILGTSVLLLSACSRQGPTGGGNINGGALSSMALSSSFSSSSRMPAVSQLTDDQRADALRANKAIAEKALGEPIPEHFLVYRNEELGFSFRYAPEWGEPVFTKTTYENPEGEACHSFSGYFGTPESIVPMYFRAVLSRCIWDRATGMAEEISQREKPLSRRVGQVSVNFEEEVGWETKRTDFVLRAPIRDDELEFIGATGPVSNAPWTSPDDIRNFIFLAKSYVLLK